MVFVFLLSLLLLLFGCRRRLNLRVIVCLSDIQVEFSGYYQFFLDVESLLGVGKWERSFSFCFLGVFRLELGFFY